MAESEEELKSLLMKVKEESEKPDLKMIWYTYVLQNDYHNKVRQYIFHLSKKKKIKNKK